MSDLVLYGGYARGRRVRGQDEQEDALVAAGLTNEAIAERLVLSVRTVEHHLSNIYAKLRLSGKAARAAAAVSFIEQRAVAGRHSR